MDVAPSVCPGELGATVEGIFAVPAVLFAGAAAGRVLGVVLAPMVLPVPLKLSPRAPPPAVGVSFPKQLPMVGLVLDRDVFGRNVMYGVEDECVWGREQAREW